MLFRAGRFSALGQAQGASRSTCPPWGEMPSLGLLAWSPLKSKVGEAAGQSLHTQTGPWENPDSQHLNCPILQMRKRAQREVTCLWTQRDRALVI